MDDPLLVALGLVVPYVLGFLLRLKGAFLAAMGLSGVAGWSALNDLNGGPSDSVVGALALGAGAGFALGWAGSLTRRLLR